MTTAFQSELEKNYHEPVWLVELDNDEKQSMWAHARKVWNKRGN
jgi:hypothetical protein